VDVEQTRQLEVGGEPGRAGHLFAAFEPPIAQADHTHRPIIAWLAIWAA
jgi:hypothetical protein